MADTTFPQGEVERHARERLAVDRGIPFHLKVAPLMPGGPRELDAVSEDPSRPSRTRKHSGGHVTPDDDRVNPCLGRGARSLED